MEFEEVNNRLEQILEIVDGFQFSQLQPLARLHPFKGTMQFCTYFAHQHTQKLRFRKLNQVDAEHSGVNATLMFLLILLLHLCRFVGNVDQLHQMLLHSDYIYFNYQLVVNLLFVNLKSPPQFLPFEPPLNLLESLSLQDTGEKIFLLLKVTPDSEIRVGKLQLIRELLKNRHHKLVNLLRSPIKNNSGKMLAVEYLQWNEKGLPDLVILFIINSPNDSVVRQVKQILHIAQFEFQSCQRQNLLVQVLQVLNS